jgi:hypothetical protein
LKRRIGLRTIFDVSDSSSKGTEEGEELYVAAAMILRQFELRV